MSSKVSASCNNNNNNNNNNKVSTDNLKTSTDPIKNKIFKRFQRPNNNNNHKQNTMRSGNNNIIINNPARSNHLNGIFDNASDNASQEEAIEEAIEIIQSAGGPQPPKLERSESLQKRGSMISSRGAKELLHDNSDRLSVLMSTCQLMTDDYFTSSDESDFDE